MSLLTWWRTRVDPLTSVSTSGFRRWRHGSLHPSRCAGKCLVSRSWSSCYRPVVSSWSCHDTAGRRGAGRSTTDAGTCSPCSPVQQSAPLTYQQHASLIAKLLHSAYNLETALFRVSVATAGSRNSDWLSMVLRLHQHNIGYTADGFYRSDDPTNSVKALKEGG